MAAMGCSAVTRNCQNHLFRWRLCLCATFVFLSAVFAAMPVAADSFDEGVTAHQEGQPEAALRVWTDAAEQGHFLAQYNLGIMYLEGQGVARSYGAAVRWFSRASQAGFAPAVVNLGLLFERGLGVPMDGVVALAHLDAGTEALSDGQCRDLAHERQLRVAAGLDMAARAQAENEARALRQRLWTQSFLVPAGKCFESVAYSGGKVQGPKSGAQPSLKKEASAVREEPDERPAPPPQHRPAPRKSDAPPKKTGDALAYFIQMISLKREAAARRELARLRKRYANLFGRTDLILVKAERAGSGTVYRVRAGPFRERQAAHGLCEGLRERGQDCFVVQNRVPGPQQGAQ